MAKATAIVTGLGGSAADSAVINFQYCSGGTVDSSSISADLTQSQATIAAQIRQAVSDALLPVGIAVDPGDVTLLFYPS